MTPAVTISASFRAGSIFDPVDLPGLAYLTGRVIDRGTDDGGPPPCWPTRSTNAACRCGSRRIARR